MTNTEIPKRLTKDQKKLAQFMAESGILEGLEEIQTELLNPHHIHNVLWHNDSTIRLVWGKHFELDQYGVPRLVIVKPWILGWVIGQGEQILHDWNKIEIHINIFRNEISIGNVVITRPEWRRDPSKIPDTLAKAYLNPEKPPYR